MAFGAVVIFCIIGNKIVTKEPHHGQYYVSLFCFCLLMK